MDFLVTHCQQCVLCHTVYAAQVDRNGEEILVPEGTQAQPNTTPVTQHTQQAQVNTVSLCLWQCALLTLFLVQLLSRLWSKRTCWK